VFDANGIDLGVLILRVMVGVTMFAHGYNHVWRGGKIDGTAGWFGSLGMKPGKLHAWLASITELVCGPMLILGLLNPLAAAGVVGVMFVAFWINHRPNGFFIFRPGEGYEYVLNLLAAGLALGAIGPGEWSLDNVIGLETSGLVPFAITAVAGLGGAVGLLVVFWRPDPKPAEEDA
jgi:putative oxidoreductase